MRPSSSESARVPLHSSAAPAERLPILLGFACVVLALVPGFFALDGTWIYDDTSLIRDNDYLHDFSYWKRWFSTDFWDAGREHQYANRVRYYRPLVSLSYAFDWALGGGRPGVFHGTNLTLMALIAGLVFRTLLRWLQDARWAFLATLFYVWHPAKMESVAWISGRPDLLLSFFSFVALTGVARALRQRRGGWILLLAGLVGALLSKEQAVVFPVLALLECWVFLGKPGWSWSTLRALWNPALQFVLPPLFLCVLYVMLRTSFLPMEGFATGQRGAVQIGLRALETLGRLNCLLLWPQDLSFFSSVLRFSPEGVLPHRGFVTFGLVVLLTLITLMIGYRLRRPLFAAACALYGALLLPVMNLVPVGTTFLTAPRFLFLPSFAVCYAFGEALQAIPVGRWRRAVLTLSGVVLVVWCGWGARRALDFRTPEDFWRSEVRAHPDVAEPYSLLVAMDVKEGEFRRAIHRGFCAYRLAERDHHWSVAAGLFKRAIQLDSSRTPESDRDKLALTAEFLEAVLEGRLAHLDVLLSDGMRLEVSVVPKSPQARELTKASATQWLLVGQIAMRLGEEERARRAIERAEQSCPRCDDVRWGAADLWMKLGEGARARALLEAGPSPPELMMQLRRSTELSERAARLEPGLERALLLAQRDGDFQLATRALGHIAPFEKEFLGVDPEVSLAYGQLALRAGHLSLAERVGGQLPLAQAHDLALEAGLLRADRRSALPEFLPGTCAVASDLW